MNIEIKSTSYLIPNNSSWESLHKDNKLKFAEYNNISFRSIRFPALNSRQSISLNNPNPPSLFQYLESNPKMVNKIF